MIPLREFLVYGVGGAASRLAAIFLVPLYTRALSVDDYGRLELALAVHALVVILAGLQVESAVARDILEARSQGQRPALAWAALALTAAGSAAATIVLWGVTASGIFEAWLDSWTLIALAALTLPAQLFGVQLVMLRFEGRAVWYASLALLDLLLTAALSLWFIVGLGWGILGALAGILAAKCACLLLAWPLTIGSVFPIRGRALPDRGWARRLLEYGVPALPAVVVSWAQNAGSRVFTAAALPMQDVAIAALAVKVAAIFGFIIYSLRLAWEPHSIASLNQHACNPNYFRRALEWYVMAMFLALGVAALTVPWAVELLAPAVYAPAASVAVVAVVAHYWVGATNMMVIGIQGARQMTRMLPVYAWGAAANVLALFALAPATGPLSAAIGMLVGAVISALLAAHFSNQLFETRFPMRLLHCAVLTSTTLAIALLGGMAYAGNPASHASHLAPLAWFGSGIGVIVALTVLMAMGGLGRERSAQMWHEAIALLGSRGRPS